MCHDLACFVKQYGYAFSHDYGPIECQKCGRLLGMFSTTGYIETRRRQYAATASERDPRDLGFGASSERLRGAPASGKVKRASNGLMLNTLSLWRLVAPSG